MKKFFTPFTGESLLIGLGLTFLTYMITPIVKEIYKEAISNNKNIAHLGDEFEGRFVPDKSSLT